MLKKRCKVGSPTLNPPQIRAVISVPIIGIAVNIFVITVAPQKLI
jgi:hypothetical protein